MINPKPLSVPIQEERCSVVEEGKIGFLIFILYMFTLFDFYNKVISFL